MSVSKRAELDYLICNAPLEYSDLILNGNPETYLKTVTEYKILDSDNEQCHYQNAKGRSAGIQQCALYWA